VSCVHHHVINWDKLLLRRKDEIHERAVSLRLQPLFLVLPRR